MSNYTAEDIIRIVKEENVRFIRLQFTDIFGSFKNIAITASQLEKALQNLSLIHICITGSIIAAGIITFLPEILRLSLIHI